LCAEAEAEATGTASGTATIRQDFLSINGV
jgi:hypothetical protein